METAYYENEFFPFIKPMERYLYLCGEQANDFINHLISMDTPYIKCRLEPLFHYGIIDILLPFNEFVLNSFKDEEQEDWWKELVKSMENSYIVCDFEEKFHSRIINGDFHKNYQMFPHVWEVLVNSGGLNDWVWISISNKVQDYLESNGDLIGFITPGLLSVHLNKWILSLLNKYVLPRLLYELGDGSNSTNSLNKFEKKALKYIVMITSRCLGTLYYGEFSKKYPLLLEKVASMKRGFYDLKDDELREALFDGSYYIPDYINLEYLNNINRLNDCVEELKINDFVYRRLKLVAPLLHQCIGENDKANDLLLKIFDTSNTYDKYTMTILVSALRAISQTSDENSFLLKKKIYLLWNNDKIPESLIDTLKSIVDFFRELSYEIPKRFCETGLQEIIDNADYDDISFYDFYSERVAKVNNDIKALSIVSPLLFENLDAVKRLEQYVDTIKDERLKYSVRIQALVDFERLCASLASHIGREPRIDTRNCFRIMWRDQFLSFPELEHAISSYKFKNEILRVYSYSQRKRLEKLNEQFNACRQDIPSVAGIQAFEAFNFDNDKQIINEPTNNQYEKLIAIAEMNKDGLDELKKGQEKIYGAMNDMHGDVLNISADIIDIKNATEQFYGFLNLIDNEVKKNNSDVTDVSKELSELKKDWDEYINKANKDVKKKILDTLTVLGSIATLSTIPQVQYAVEQLRIIVNSLGIF